MIDIMHFYFIFKNSENDLPINKYIEWINH